jgi:hypothetical protein
MKSKLAIALLIAGVVSIGGWSGHGQTSKPRDVTYQYKVIYDPTEEFGQDEGVDKLNELGAQGWEIIGTTRYANNHARLYLKRTIR